MQLDWITALVLGIVEGLTEFLPVSSTGHLILAGALLHYQGAQAVAVEIVIQGAAILAVCWEYRRMLTRTALTFVHEPSSRRFALNLLLGFLPLAILGLAFKDEIERYLFHPVPVAIALVVGGVLILLVDRHEDTATLKLADDVQPAMALRLGLWQALALIPGTSRAAATIIGGVTMGMSRRLATEYSFFLAIPTLLAATAYKLVESADLLTGETIGPLLLSAACAFVTALLAVRGFIRYVASHSFAAFAWYRIGFGGLVLAAAALGWFDAA
ncbi:MAG: undecaprenyl-diphosphate phosphatase [Gammaproteobacteria bacterium]|nr:undecaprenyl-diphosphate phosphatase [Gammaproteobacteria bacterium]